MEVLRTPARGRGICIGKAFVVKTDDSPGSVLFQCDFATALERTRAELEALAKESDIFAAHHEMSLDPMIEETFEQYKDDFVDDATACRESCEALCHLFEDIDDEYLKARVDDVRDVFNRILDHIEGRSRADRFAGLEEGCVVVAENLTPSDTKLMDMSSVAGFVTEGGSTTSHVCIIAANYGKTAMVGVGGATGQIRDGQLLLVDANEGIVFVEPEEYILEEYRHRLHEADEKLSQTDVHALARTKAGKAVPVLCNAGGVQEVRNAIEAGADGIGLLRSEFLYMESVSGFPSEETQFSAYREAAQVCGDKVLTIRTLDIGGDKQLPYWRGPKEENPYLGFRAIRISLAMPDMFKAQLRAILRSSAFGNVRIMFPMITSCEELGAALRILDECRDELDAAGIAFDREIKKVIMIETPAAVLLAGELAGMVDFFSLGTNDLIQYITVADRGNSSIAHIYDPYAASVQKAIKMTIDGAHSKGIECCMCGELASNQDATDRLLEYGLDSFSVSAPAIASIKTKISEFTPQA